MTIEVGRDCFVFAGVVGEGQGFTEGPYHLYPSQAREQIEAYRPGDILTGPHSSRVGRIGLRVSVAGGASHQPFGLFLVAASLGFYDEPQAFFWCEAVVKLPQPILLHPAFGLPLSTPSSASKRPSNSCISLHLRSSSTARRRVFKSRLATVAMLLSRSPERTSSVSSLKSAFTSPSFPAGLGLPRTPLLPPLDALRLRSWTCAGEC